MERADGNFYAAFCVIKEGLPVLAQHLSLLHPEEHACYRTFRTDIRRESYLLGRYAAKFALAHLEEIKDLHSLYIDSGIFQFPVVRSESGIAGNKQVCISHCDHFCAALAFPEAHPLGIDIEEIDPEKVLLIREYLTVRENELIKAAGIPELIGCILMWTAKEALSKILRTGLTLDMSILEIDSWRQDGPLQHITFRNFSQYRSVSFHSEHHVCSLVVPRQTTLPSHKFHNSFMALSNGTKLPG